MNRMVLFGARGNNGLLQLKENDSEIMFLIVNILYVYIMISL